MNIKKIFITLLFITAYSPAMDQNKQKEIEKRIAYLMKKSNKELSRAQMFEPQEPVITVHINGIQLNSNHIDKETKQQLLTSFYAQEKYKKAVKNYEQKIKENDN